MAPTSKFVAHEENGGNQLICEDELLCRLAQSPGRWKSRDQAPQESYIATLRRSLHVLSIQRLLVASAPSYLERLL